MSSRPSSGALGARAISGVGSFSLLLGLVLLVLTAGIFWFDAEFARLRTEEASHDAKESTLLLTNRIDMKLEWLGTFRALHLMPNVLERSAFEALLVPPPRDTAALAGVERVWMIDSLGSLMHEAALRGAAEGLPLDPLALEASRHALASGESRVSTAGNAVETRRVIISKPLMLDGRLVGVAAASVRPSTLLVSGAHAGERDGTVLLQPPDTLAAVGDLLEDQEALRARDSTVVHDSKQWVIEVTRRPDDIVDRNATIALAVLTLTFLAVVLMRERRQAQRVTERSQELERLSSELLRANRMKSEFLANVSHELRTPLNAIVGFVELLRDGVYGELSPRQAQPVERIAASATHLRGLVDQVLDIAKMAAGRLEVHPETIVLRPFVLNVMSELESLIAEKGLSLSISVGASLPRVRTDPAHLRSILVNLIGNAIKYTQQGGIVVRARLVGAPRTAMVSQTGERAAGERTLMEESALAANAPSREQPWIALQVIDTGIGIATEDQERIFDEFEQVNAGPRGESMMRGTGLGLAITRRLARLLGGDVRVESEQGRGSTFTLWMPVSVGDLAPKP